MHIKSSSPKRNITDILFSPNIVLLLIVITGFILRLYRINYRSLNFDEANSIAFAKNSILHMLKETPFSIGDLHPPLFHILLHFWIYVSDTEFWARLISAICGTAAIYITYLLGRCLFSLRTAMLAAFLTMVSTFNISYSQDARMYSLFTLLTVLSVYFFFKSIDMEHRTHWIWFTIFSILNIYTHYVAIIILFAEAMLFVLKWETYSHLRLKFFSSLAVIFISFLPWIPAVFNQFTAGDGQMSEFSFGTGLIIPYSFFVFGSGETLLQIKDAGDLISNLIPIIIVATIFIISLYNSAVKSSEKRLTFITIIPILILYILSWKIPRIFISVKYIIAVSPMYYLLIANGLTNIKKDFYQPVLAALITLINIISLWNYHYDERFKPEDWRDSAKYISMRLTEKDVILFDAGHIEVVFDYYCKCDVKKVKLTPKKTEDREVELQRIKREVSPYKNIWLILSHNWKTGDYYKRILDGHLIRTSEYRTKGIEIYSYMRI